MYHCCLSRLCVFFLLSLQDLANLLDVDMRTSYTCVVTTSPDEDQERRGFLEQIIGISQYFMLPQRTDEGEMAFLVCDAFQGKYVHKVNARER